MKNVMMTVLVLAALAAAGAENPAKEFREAMRNGRPLTAERAFRRLVETTPNVTAEDYRLGAEAARQNRQPTLRTDRLAQYLRTERGWNENVEAAAWELCRQGGDAEVFVRLADRVDASRALFDVGRRLQGLYYESSRAAELLKVSDRMFAKFTDPKDRDQVLTPVYGLMSRDLGGFPKGDVLRFILDHPFAYTNPSGRWECGPSVVVNNEAANAEYVLDYILATKAPVPSHPAFTKVANAMRDQKQKPSKALVEKFLKIEPILFADDAKFGYDILRSWYGVRCEPGLQGLFPEISDGAKNSAKLADVYRKLAKKLPKNYDQTVLREHANWLNRENVRLSVADEKKLAAEFPRAFEKESVYEKDVSGTSKALSDVWKGLSKLQRNGQNCPAAAHGLFKKALAAYPGTYPDDAARPRESRQFGDIMYKYFDLCHQSPDGCKAILENVCDRLSADSDRWGWISHCLNGCKPWQTDADRPVYEKTMVRMSQVVPKEVSWLPGYSPKKGATKLLPDGFAIDGLPPSSRARIFGNVLFAGKEADYSPALRAQALVELAKRTNAAENWDLGRVLGCLAPLVSNDLVRAQFPYDKVAGELLDNPKPGQRTDLRCDFIALAGRTDPARRDRYLQRYLAALDKLPVENRIDALAGVLGYRPPELLGYPRDSDPKDKPAADTFTPVFRDRFLPAFKSVSRARAPLVNFDNAGFFGRVEELVGQKANAAAASVYTNDFASAYLRLIDAGLRLNDNSETYRALDWWLFTRACPGDRVTLAKVGAELGFAARDWYPGGGAVLARLNQLAEKDDWESVYLVVKNLHVDGNVFRADTVSAFSQLAATASTKLPGIYPVSEKDPSYPLYVAADEYNRRNTERAWDLLQKNLPAFERSAVKLPPDFTGWAVEQLRLQRGKKDELLVKARTIATALLVDESKLSHELAAQLLLTRAESYRDQQNFEAAKLEYQTIRNSPVYHATPAGRKAMFRAVDLQIDLGNASAAEATIEYWLSQPEPDVQAEAHYFLARIAYERQDYDETIKQLREVFAIDFTHTEARFLQGKWKLATGSEVDDTEVMIGSLTDRTTIRPGQPLTITVQDRNLSVAGGGASIPVVVKTEPGGDLEYVQLYPSVRDPNLFKGVVDIQLGKPSPSNMVLEVTGADRASYVIDPAFLKTRGLPLNRPKVLEVVDDARLAIGAGAPRADEAKSKKELAQKLDEGSGPSADDGTSALAAKLRPGNPLYIVVSDKDRSNGRDGNTVDVTVETTSGDVLSGLKLKEMRPYSGLFRGEVPTALPPPRAFASDSAVGFNAGDAINSGKSGHWKSLADGKPGKWIEVDTMASHAVKEARIKMPAPEEVRAIRLVGRLSTETMELGSLPAGKPEDKAGLWIQQQHFAYGGAPKKSADEVRAWFQSPRAPKAAKLEKFEFTPLKHWDKNQKHLPQFAYVSGVFAQPKGTDYLRFRFVPTAKSRDAFRNLWVVVAVDGEKVFEGQGVRLADDVATCEALAGAHRLELFVNCVRAEDAFELQYEAMGEDPVAVPTDWFDMGKHDPIRKFLSDKAVIEKTKDGFTATFEKPVRMRSLRWEFVNIAGQSVDVEKLFVTDKAGETVIPVATDFTDAQQNDTLEVAPGDKISVAYADERTTSGETRVLDKSIDSSFNDADVHFYFEVNEPVTDATGATSYHNNVYDAYRFQPGDTLIVAVRDSDLDLTPEEDKTTVWVSSSDGTRREMELLEVKSLGRNCTGQGWDIDGFHSCLYAGLLKTCRKEDAEKNPKALPVKEDDVLTLAYEDRENTNPGIPFVRTAKVQAMGPKTPQLTLFHTRKTQEIDRSVKAMRRLEAIRRRPGNEQVTNLYRDVLWAIPMTRAVCASTNPIPVNVATPVPVRVSDPSLARHQGSRLFVEAVAGSELKRHEEEGGELASVEVPLVVGGPFENFKLKKGAESKGEARASGSFNGVLYLCLGAAELAAHDEELAMRKGEPPPVLGVNGSDTIRLRVYEKQKDGMTPKPHILERTLKLVSNGALRLMDSTWNAERTAAHAGEKFFVAVDDADRDLSEDPDKVTVDVRTASGSYTNRLELVESMPHSGIFQGTLPLATESFKYGDRILFSYGDEVTLPGTAPRTLCATGMIHRGADGSVRLFSKRFRDRDMAVLVQFRLAECLFEQAKEFRSLKQKEKSSEAIARGKAILEEALRNYPDSSHVAQGEFLLANLYQELATEEKDAGNADEAQKLYQEALGRFTSILAVWPEGEYGAKSQFHKAFCLEMLGDFRLAGEEYVKMTYLYPESDLIGDATIRLATYYFKKEKRYGIAGKIYENFQKRFPNHEKAARSAFMAGSCYVKEGERLQKEWEDAGRKSTSNEARKMYEKAIRAFIAMQENFRNAPPVLKAQALYWAGDTALKAGRDKDSYFYLKRTILEYPETEWARRARGLLLQETERFKKME